jgi:CubicO group peptidase (beta-lactamase class C family)
MNTIKNILLACSLSLGVFTSVYGQFTIKGKILNHSDNLPIAYVNIGVLNSNFGTISNSDGSFSLKISQLNSTKEVLFSAIGFEQQSISIALLIDGKENIIRLKEKITTLDEVVITSVSKKKKYKDQWLGNRKRHLMVQGMMLADSASAGGAMALLIDKKKDFSYIQKAALFITRNTRPEFKVRLRFLNVDEANNNVPGEDLFNESIVIQSSKQRGWLDFDLTQYSYRIPQESFFLMFEWIIEDKDRIEMYMTTKKYEEQNPDRIKKDSVSVDGESIATKTYSSYAPIPIIAFGTTKTKSDLRKHKCYIRSSSFAEWKRSTGIISAKVLMSNKPSKKSSSSNGDVIVSENQEETLESKIEKWGKAFRENYNIPGMQLSVSLKSNTLFSGGFGYSDVENEEKVNSQTRFRIASVTKPMTAVAVMKLASENKLDLDADVRKYVPSFPEKKHTITTRQLAGHLGGIRDYYEISIDEIIKNPHFENATEAINVFKNDSLMSKPGDQFLYSSFGYNLIGAAIEGASKQTYLEYMKENIWKPLLMFNTYGDIAGSTMIHKSKFYYPNEEEAKPYDLSYAHASGGVISTTGDLLRFGNEMLYGGLFKYSFKKKLFKTQYTKDRKPTDYGLGWYIGKDINRYKIWYHVGQSPSSGAVLIVYPDDDIVISLLANTPILVNSDDGLPIEIQKLAELIYKN